MNLKILLRFLMIPVYFLYTHGISSDFSSTNYARGAAEYLKLSRHAHSAALSNAVVAWQDGLAGIQYNPAILDIAGINEIPLFASYSFMSLDRKHFGIDAVLGIGEYVVTGLSLTNFGIKNIEGRDSLGNPTETFHYGTNTYALSVAGRLRWTLSWGVTARYIHENLADEKANGLGFDIGITFNPIKQLCLGLSGQNLLSRVWWSTGHKDTVFSTVRFGLAGQFMDKSLIAELDLSKTLKHPLDISLGFQYRFLKVLYLRTGLATSIDVKDRDYRTFDYSFGIGMRYQQFGICYALPVTSSKLGLIHKITVTCKMPSFFKLL